MSRNRLDAAVLESADNTGREETAVLDTDTPAPLSRSERATLTLDADTLDDTEAADADDDGAPAEEGEERGSPASGRDSRGRFTRGNAGGPGNPFGRYAAGLRRVLVHSVTAEDMHAIARKLVEQSLAGNHAAVKLLLSYTLGKPEPQVNPDRVDFNEWQCYQDAARIFAQLPEMAKTPSPELALTWLRAMLPAMARDMGQTLVDVSKLPARKREDATWNMRKWGTAGLHAFMKNRAAGLKGARRRAEAQAAAAAQANGEHANGAPSTDGTNGAPGPESVLSHGARAPETDLSYGAGAPETHLSHGAGAPETDLSHGARTPESDLSHTSRAPESDLSHGSGAPESDLWHGAPAPETALPHRANLPAAPSRNGGDGELSAAPPSPIDTNGPGAEVNISPPPSAIGGNGGRRRRSKRGRRPSPDGPIGAEPAGVSPVGVSATGVGAGMPDAAAAELAEAYFAALKTVAAGLMKPPSSNGGNGAAIGSDGSPPPSPEGRDEQGR